MKNTDSRPQGGAPERVFIGRDFSDGTGVQFSLEFPDELKSRIDEEKFRKQIEKINKIFSEAESLSTPVVMENLFGCLSGYLIYLCIPTHYEKCLKKVSALVYEINRVLIKEGLLLIDPSERGLRVLEICIMDKR